MGQFVLAERDFDLVPRKPTVGRVLRSTTLDLNPLLYVIANARRRRVRRISLIAVLAETALAFTHVDLLGAARPIRLRRRFAFASSHVQRFVTETTALALMSAAAENLYGWRVIDAPASFDEVPLRPPRGPRPDLLYPLAAGDIAGESRGRTSPAGDAQMAGRLRELRTWAAGQGAPRWFLSWATLSLKGTSVDVFDPGSGTTAEPSQLHALDERWTASARAEEGLERQTILGISVMGSWVRANPFPLAGEPEMQLVLGISDQPISDRDLAFSLERRVVGVTTSGQLVAALVRAQTAEAAARIIRD